MKRMATVALFTMSVPKARTALRFPGLRMGTPLQVTGQVEGVAFPVLQEFGWLAWIRTNVPVASEIIWIAVGSRI
jgi:hypothetical protein